LITCDYLEINRIGTDIARVRDQCDRAISKRLGRELEHEERTADTCPSSTGNAVAVVCGNGPVRESSTRGIDVKPSFEGENVLMTTVNPNRQRGPLKPLAWKEINEPGAYVDLTTGALYRVPPQALVDGAEPLIEKQQGPDSQLLQANGLSFDRSQFVQVSRNPFIVALGARLICVEHHIRPAF
jgi:hypothetical protein